ncbi:hypothetical protein IJD34_06615 [bacterium]|nr:hypothetical protein [bacterium]
MKKNTNIIQIRGIRGLIVAMGVVCCLIAGFVVFPGWVCMNLWNISSKFFSNIPTIGIIQGILLWGIIYLTYKTLRKDKLVVCIKSPQGLSEDELKDIFADIKKQSKEDLVLQAMIKAKESELKIKALDMENKETEQQPDSTNV